MDYNVNVKDESLLLESGDDIENLKKAKEQLRKLYKYQNDYNKTHYDRFSLLLPEGTKDRIRNLKLKCSLNAFIVHWVLKGIAQEEERLQKGKGNGGGEAE